MGTWEEAALYAVWQATHPLCNALLSAAQPLAMLPSTHFPGQSKHQRPVTATPTRSLKKPFRGQLPG